MTEADASKEMKEKDAATHEQKFEEIVEAIEQA